MAVSVGNGQLNQVTMLEVTNALDAMHDQQAILLGGGEKLTEQKSVVRRLTPIVIFINHTYRDEPKTEEIKSIQYTALTRARFYLYVIDYEIKL